MSDEVKIGPVLKHLMKNKKMTFKKLSHASGVPISTIKTWSAGVEPKSLSYARKVARALGVSVLNICHHFSGDIRMQRLERYTCMTGTRAMRICFNNAVCTVQSK